jgi:hypothetical protein
MAMGSNNNMPPKLVLAWLNSFAWASKPKSILRSSYSFKEINTIKKQHQCHQWEKLVAWRKKIPIAVTMMLEGL